MTAYFLTDNWNEHAKARAVPGSFYSREAGGYIFKDPTPRTAAVALKLFPHLISAHPELLVIREQLAQDVRPRDYASEWFAELVAPWDFAPRVSRALEAAGKSFYHYQRVDLSYIAAVMKDHGSAYLAWQRGLGKTLGTCAVIDDLDCKRTLVVCGNSVKQAVWADELAEYAPWVQTIVLPNEKRKRERALDWVREHSDHGSFALVIHYEALNVIARERASRRGWDRYGTWDLVVADAAHRVSNPDTQMAHALKRIKTHHKLALSGSVIQNRAEELFSQLQWLFPDRYSSKWRDWNDRFLDYVDSGFANVCVGIRVEKLPEMRDELGRFMVVRSKEDVLEDLPPITEETRLVELGRQQRQAYDSLKDSYVAELGDGSYIKATDAITLLTRLRQVSTGLDLLSDTLVDSAKLDLAVELIEDNPDDAFVVFSWFKGAAKALHDRLGANNCFVVTGETKPRDRAEYIRRFQSGEKRIFIGTISTLGEGVTLSRANNVIFIDRSWNPASNGEAMDRVAGGIRALQVAKPITVTYIVARDTVDESAVTPALTDKLALRRMILGTGEHTTSHIHEPVPQPLEAA